MLTLLDAIMPVLQYTATTMLCHIVWEASMVKILCPRTAALRSWQAYGPVARSRYS